MTSVLAYIEREFLLADGREPRSTLRGRITLPAGADGSARALPWVLVLHGFKGFMDWGFFPELARRLAEVGLAVVRFNFSGSGHGKRPLEFTEPDDFFANTPSRELEDVERMRAWFDSASAPRWLDPERGAVLGHSLGGAVALLHAARRGDYRAVVGWATCANLRRFPSDVEALWRRRGFIEVTNARTKQVHRLGLGWLLDLDRRAAELDVVAACRKLTAPLLLLHGRDDESVPAEESEALARACPPGVARLELVPAANHTFSAVHPFAGSTPALEHVLGTTVAFLRTRLLGSGGNSNRVC